MLQLLQQRTKLSGKIGAMKRRHGAVVYVPERERDLIARLLLLNKGQLSARAVAAVYREILSSSRAAQGQMPIGFLKASASVVRAASGAAFGACDQYAPKKSWRELAKGLDAGDLSLGLLTGEELAAVVATSGGRDEFAEWFQVSGDFTADAGEKTSPGQRIYIVTQRRSGPPVKANRILILIECKSTLNAIKSLLHAMPDFSLQAEPLNRQHPKIGGSRGSAVVRLSLARPVDGARAIRKVLAVGEAVHLKMSLLGIYPATEVYGG